MRDALTLLDQLVAFGGPGGGRRACGRGPRSDRSGAPHSRSCEACARRGRGGGAGGVPACLGARAWPRSGSARRCLPRCATWWSLRIAPDRGLVEGADAELAAAHRLGRACRGRARLRRMFRALLQASRRSWPGRPTPSQCSRWPWCGCATLAPGDRVEELLARIDRARTLAGRDTGEVAPEAVRRMTGDEPRASRVAATPRRGPAQGAAPGFRRSRLRQRPLRAPPSTLRSKAALVDLQAPPEPATGRRRSEPASGPGRRSRRSSDRLPRVRPGGESEG